LNLASETHCICHSLAAVMKAISSRRLSNYSVCVMVGRPFVNTQANINLTARASKATKGNN